jgi:transketolase
MRDAFAREITDVASRRKDVALLSGDIGNRMFEKYKEVAPDRFVNCGIAEANMMSVAAGMALSGLRPVVYTIAPFTTYRCLEQIRIGAAYHEAPVVIVGTGAGLSYSELGPTHHSLEDVSIIRSIPGINVLAPADSMELVAHLNEALNHTLPTYIRIGKKGEPLIHSSSANLGIGKSQVLREGREALVISSGPIITEAILAAEMLSSESMEITVVNIGSLKPLDNRLLEKILTKHTHAFTLEEHGPIGGLASAISDWLRTTSLRTRITSLCTPDEFIHRIGPQSYTRKDHGLDAASICKSIKNSIRNP